MFLHSFKYSLKTLTRDRGQMFWCLLFPLVLAVLFQFAFSNLDKSEAFEAIPVAVLYESEDAKAEFSETIDALSTGDDAFIQIVSTDSEAADELLEAKEIIGILSFGDQLTLTLSADMSSELLRQSILETFTDHINLTYGTIHEIVKTHPEKMPEVIEALQEETNYIVEQSFTQGNYSSSLSYFFNLIAMACLYASFLGNTVAIHHQANLSTLGARRAISPTRKMISVLGGLCSAVIIETASVYIGIFFMKYFLKVDFGNQFGYVLLLAFVGCVAGISFGFFVGSVGKFSCNVKFGILVSASMLCSTLSGLMFAQMQIYVNQVCPWVNTINPAALITNSLFSLVIFPSRAQFLHNVLLLLIESIIFYVLGLLVIRRRKYASL